MELFNILQQVLGNWALGIGNWAWGIGHWAFVIGHLLFPRVSASPRLRVLPIPPHPLHLPHPQR
jgi:hypothetical protein